ncbi:HD domain-containing protein [Nocardia wallacei]|uniref:HD domain-containing protein n=1 Tax=Nocardia wallacei TaxID=480035 RepID=UPI002455E53D|nr:HD domain-containing protein [Nocardia wallacei]
MSELVSDARILAEARLAEDLPRRWRHVSGVARQGTRIAPALGAEGETLIAACWLHDIGYAPPLATTKFHPLDGAVYLRSLGWGDRIVSLVARHSCAIREARMRGLDRELSVFADEDSLLRDALWYCDMTTGPDGELLTIDQRIAEILSRYGAGTLVYEFINEARAELSAAVQRTESRIAGFDLAEIRLG